MVEGREPPAILISIVLETEGRISFHCCDDPEDMRRLALWMHRAGVLSRLRAAVDVLEERLERAVGE
jgi:hypothetical protein